MEVRGTVMGQGTVRRARGTGAGPGVHLGSGEGSELSVSEHPLCPGTVLSLRIQQQRN